MGCRFCGGFDFLKPINKSMLWDKSRIREAREDVGRPVQGYLVYKFWPSKVLETSIKSRIVVYFATFCDKRPKNGSKRPLG